MLQQIPAFTGDEAWLAGGPRDRAPGAGAAIGALRCYAQRDSAEPAYVRLKSWSEVSGIGLRTTIALATMFEMTEGCLGRPLVASVQGDARLTTDEEGVLMLLSLQGEPSTHCGSATIPHGLPGALAWAVQSARKLCGGATAAPGSARHACPFQG